VIVIVGYDKRPVPLPDDHRLAAPENAKGQRKR